MKDWPPSLQEPQGWKDLQTSKTVCYEEVKPPKPMSPWGWDESPGHWAGCFQLWQCRQLLSCLPTSLANAVQLVALNAISQTEAQAAQAPATEQEEAGVTMTRKNTTGAAGKAFETLIFQTSWNSRWFQSIPKYQYVSSTFFDIADETTSSHVGKDSK